MAIDTAGLSIETTEINVDGGLVDYHEAAMRRVAIAAGVPASQLTGEEPKYANVFATRAQYLRSDAASAAREVSSALLPLLDAIAAGTGDDNAGAVPELRGKVWWLDPVLMIEEQHEDAAMRGPMTAAVDTLVDDDLTVKERQRRRRLIAAGFSIAAINAWAEMADDSIWAAVRKAIPDGSPKTIFATETAGQIAARVAPILRAITNSVDGLATLGATIPTPADTVLIGAVTEAVRIAEADTFATAVDEVVRNVRLEVFGRPIDGGDRSAGLLDTILVATALQLDDDMLREWVYGSLEERQNPYFPHYELDGMTGRQRGDFPAEEPDGEAAWPQGHIGCRCHLRLVDEDRQ